MLALNARKATTSRARHAVSARGCTVIAVLVTNCRRIAVVRHPIDDLRLLAGV
jgi:hypothetical protein